MEKSLKIIKNLQYEINNTDNIIRDIYNELVEKVKALGKVIYFCNEEHIKNSVKETFEKFKVLGGVEELPEFYYNDENGVEKFCYLFYFDEGGIYVADCDTFSLLNFTIYEFNGISEKLSVLEIILNNLE